MTTVSFLITPLKSHEKLQYPCPACGESFAKYEAYNKHRCGSSYRNIRPSAVEDFLGVKYTV